MDRTAYDAIDAVNWSSLRHLLRSPAHYRAALLTPTEDTPARRLGRVRHLAVLEPERFLSRVAVWRGGVRRGKDWATFRRDSADREIVTEDELAEVLAIQRAVRADSGARKLLSGGRGEQTIQWEHVIQALEGVPERRVQCKGRPDYVSATALVDLKTTRDASPDGFGREAWRYHHHSQLAMYRDGLEATDGKRRDVFVIAVETESPYVVQCYQLPEAALEAGREEYRTLLERLALCRSTDEWPGYGSGPLELSLPKWALDLSDDDDIAELGLVVNE